MIADQSKKRLILTGAAGSIGRCITPILQEAGWHVRGLDRVNAPDVDEMIVGDITDPAACAEAMAERDVLIHLAAYPNPADFVETIMMPNILGLHRVYEAAIAAGLSRIIQASSVQVIQHFYRENRPRPICLKHGVAPTNYYSLSKVFAEAYAEMVARQHEHLSVLAVRIGWFIRDKDEFLRCLLKPPAHDFYLAHLDCQQLFLKAVETPYHGYHCVFAVSQPQSSPLVDLRPAKKLLNYHPNYHWPYGSPGLSPEPDA